MKKITSLLMTVLMLTTMLTAFAVPASAANDETMTVTFPEGFTDTESGVVTISGHYESGGWYTCYMRQYYDFTVSVPESCILTKVTFKFGNFNRWPSVLDVSNAAVSMPDNTTMVVSFAPEENVHSVTLNGVETYNGKTVTATDNKWQFVTELTVEYTVLHTHEKDANAYHAAAAPTCVKDGSVEYWGCTHPGCVAKLNASGNVIADITVPATGEHEYDDSGICVYCKAVSASHEHEFTNGDCLCGEPAPEAETTPDPEITPAPETEPETGVPGITWELSEDGKTLTFTGEGAMPDYDSYSYERRPWHNAAGTVTTVQIDPGITTLGDFAFYRFEKLTSVTIPGSVTSIGKHAFANCTNLASVTIPGSVTSIGKNAFDNCKNLASVTIPGSVTSIGEQAFANCRNLASVTIPGSVESIGNFAFQGCLILASVTISEGVKSIGDSALAYCDSLKRIIVKASTPPSVSLSSIPQNPGLTVYVPSGAYNAYTEASGWNELMSIISEAYMVYDRPTENGTVTVDWDCFPTSAFVEGQTVTVTVTPAEGYQLKADSLLVTYKDDNGAELTAALTQDETDAAKYTFTMPKANVTVTAAFEKISDNTETGSTLSDGNVWIIAAVAVVALGGVAALVIVKKKKKPALADGNENKDEE